MALNLVQKEVQASSVSFLIHQNPTTQPPREMNEDPLATDQFAGLLTHCTAQDARLDEEMNRRRMFSLKLDLRAIKELEHLAGLVTEEDFAELLFFPKMQDFFAKTHHDENEKQAFWLTMRIRYLSRLSPPQRAKVIRAKGLTWGNPALILAELFKLPELQDRLSLISRLSYREFEALMKEIEKRNLSLQPGGKEFLSSTSTQEQEGKPPARRTWLAVGG